MILLNKFIANYFSLREPYEYPKFQNNSASRNLVLRYTENGMRRLCNINYGDAGIYIGEPRVIRDRANKFTTIQASNNYLSIKFKPGYFDEFRLLILYFERDFSVWNSAVKDYTRHYRLIEELTQRANANYSRP